MHRPLIKIIGSFLIIFTNSVLLSRVVAEENKSALARKADLIMRQNCYKCHGRPGERIRGGFGHVLDFDRLRKDENYLNLNDPSASVLYNRIESDEMPAGKNSRKLTPQEKQTILDWISAGAPSIERPKVEFSNSSSIDYIFQEIEADLETISDASSIRYLVLNHMPDAGDSEEDLEIFRDALKKLVNSLSYDPKILSLVSIDKKRMIYRLDLTTLPQNLETWEDLSRTNPYSIIAQDARTRTLRKRLKTSFPFMRGDWFAFAASRPPFYYRFLRIPDNAIELERSLGIEVNHNILNRAVLRAGFSNSNVSLNNRMIERNI